ncbi:MAG: DUF4286 family protein [Gammaproteobacteria bacterium]|nr:DUF4286 family protein [Gammaproteobacteria bacterium]
MIIYEVNIEVQKDILAEYKSWLKNHIIDMLVIDGFSSARIFTDINIGNKLTVLYELESQEKLEHYFSHEAAQMRQITKELYGDKITINRRVLKSE